MPDKAHHPLITMRGSQEALLFDPSDNSLTSSRSSISQFELDQHTAPNQSDLVFTRFEQKCGERIPADYIPCTAIQESGSSGGGGGGGVLYKFQRRMSMQLGGGGSYAYSTDSLKRLGQKGRARRGSIPCLFTSSSSSVSDISSQTNLIKSSHTAPDPFPELMASPPPPPSSSRPLIGQMHSRSQSSCVDDRLVGNGMSRSSSEDDQPDSLSNREDENLRRNTIDNTYAHRRRSKIGRNNALMEKQILVGDDSTTDITNPPTLTVPSDTTRTNVLNGLVASSSSSSIYSVPAMEPPVRHSYVHPSLIASKVRQIIQQSHSSPSSPATSRRQVMTNLTQPSGQPTTVESQCPLTAGYCTLDGGRKPSPSGSPTGSVGRVSPDRLSNLYEQSSALWSAQGYTKQMLMVYTDESNYRTVTISENMTSLEVTQMLVEKTKAGADKNWALVERLPKFNLERALEDHELVYPTYRSWGNAEHNQFWFQKDFKKYEFFANPTQFIPASMLDWKENGSPKSSPKLCQRSDRHTNLLLQNLFTTSERLPDIQGTMYMKEPRRSWKKHFFVLRASGLYYSNKGNSKEPKHLVLYAQLGDFLIYNTSNAKKTLAAPNNHCICLKPPYCVSDARELKLLCTEDEASRISWLTALRLVKYGDKLQENYAQAIKVERQSHNTENRDTPSMRSYTSSKLNVKSRVAMDFTGLGGRVVQDPNEALGVAIEEAQHWRKKAPRGHQCSRVGDCPCQLGGLLSENPAKCQHGLQSGVHMSQPWFHSGILRDDAVLAIQKDGLVDGVFLVRESQSIPGSYVLSLAHSGKVKHCTIRTFETDGDLYFSMDGGHTRFLDLIQLVEFYQLNANGLPTRLTHYVTRVV